MEFQQPKKRNDKCDEIKVRFDDKETVDNQRNDKCEEINSYTSDEKVTFGLEDDSELELYDYIDHKDDDDEIETKFDDKETVENQRNDKRKKLTVTQEKKK